MQEEVPSLKVYVPEGHKVQVLELSLEYDPIGQLRQLTDPDDENFPATHMEQYPLFASENVPEGQMEQELEPETENDPAAQFEHMLAPAIE